MTNKESIERLLQPKAKPEGELGNRIYNDIISDTAEKLSKQVVGVEEAMIMLCNERDKLIAKGKILSIGKIAQALTKEFVILKREE